MNLCIAQSAPIHAAQPLDHRVDGRCIADHVVRVEIEADFAGAGGDEEDGAEVVARLFVAIKKSLEDGLLYEYVTLEAAHRASEDFDGIGEGTSFGLCASVVARCVGDLPCVVRFADEHDDTFAATPSGSSQDQLSRSLCLSIWYRR